MDIARVVGVIHQLVQQKLVDLVDMSIMINLIGTVQDVWHVQTICMLVLIKH